MNTTCLCRTEAGGEADERFRYPCDEHIELDNREAQESGEPNPETFTAEMLCAECGEPLGSNHELCWLCDQEYQISVGDLKADEEKGA